MIIKDAYPTISHKAKSNHIVNYKNALLIGLAVAGNLAVCASSQASGITINYDFIGANWTADQETAMNYAASSFSSLFGNYFSNTGTVTLAATAYNDENVDVLASAGSKVVSTGAGTFGGGEVIRNILQGGVDLNGASADGVVNVNFAYFNQLDLNGPVPSTTYDFFSTLYHEFAHALGFASATNEFGQPYLGSRHSGSGEWATYDQFLVDENGNRVVSDGFLLNDTVWNSASQGGSSMFFNGANAVAANGGNLVNLYSPNSWAAGSSISHLDDDTLSLSKMLMASATGTGLSARDFSGIEVGVFQDLGYTRNAADPVPEPATLTLMLAGLGALGGWRARRSRA